MKILVGNNGFSFPIVSKTYNYDILSNLSVINIFSLKKIYI